MPHCSTEESSNWYDRFVNVNLSTITGRGGGKQTWLDRMEQRSSTALKGHVQWQDYVGGPELNTGAEEEE